MPTIHLTTFIAAPAKRVFDLSRNIELHKESMKGHGEEAVSGVRFGLIEKEETVTWKARHLFKKRFLRVKITAMRMPQMFIDEQIEGDFKMMKHEHHFMPCDNGTIMIDLFSFESPYGAIGRIFNKLYFTAYMKKLLEKRISLIKDYAETDKWRKLLEK
jgi:ligand-binding SRPBCC domain-containing protein